MGLLQGRFKPKNPSKYKGNVKNIIYRSSYEFKAMMFFDHNPNILEWSSEEQYIGYVSPVDQNFHKYYPDFLIKKRNKDGSVSTIMIEVKPKDQTRPPKKRDQITKGYINEVKSWGVNQAKWEYAKRYCDKKGWKFMILTENELGITD